MTDQEFQEWSIRVAHELAKNLNEHVMREQRELRNDTTPAPH